MNFKAKTVVLFCLALMTTSTASVLAAPQDEDPVLKYGPNPEVFVGEEIEFAMNSWKWRAELSARQQELILDTVAEWEDKLSASHAAMEVLREDLSQKGLSLPIDVRSIQAIDEQIRLRESELAGLTAQMKKLNGEVKLAQDELKFEQQVIQEEAGLLRDKYQLANQEHERAKKLFENKSLSASEVANLKLKVEETRTSLKNSMLRLKLVNSKLQSDLSHDVLVIADQREETRQRLENLVDMKAAIQQLKPVRRSEEINADMKLAQRMIGMARTKQFELQLENTYNLALIELAEKRMADYRRDHPEESQADEKEDDDESPVKRDDGRQSH